MVFLMRKMSIIRPIFGLIFLVSAFFISGLELQNPEENWAEERVYNHSFTKAFCDSTNFCRDFVIFCKDKEVLALKFTGAAVQLQENWQDPRSEKMKIGNC